jgi:hypothetical protein
MFIVNGSISQKTTYFFAAAFFTGAFVAVFFSPAG